MLGLYYVQVQQRSVYGRYPPSERALVEKVGHFFAKKFERIVIGRANTELVVNAFSHK